MDETLRKSDSMSPKVSFDYDNRRLFKEFVAFCFDSLLVFLCYHNLIVRYLHSTNNQLSLDLFLQNVSLRSLFHYQLISHHWSLKLINFSKQQSSCHVFKFSRIIFIYKALKTKTFLCYHTYNSFLIFSV